MWRQRKLGKGKFVAAQAEAAADKEVELGAGQPVVVPARLGLGLEGWVVARTNRSGSADWVWRRVCSSARMQG